MPLINCPRCNGQIADDAIRCPHCGEQLQPRVELQQGEMECPNCGHPYTDERICAVCGQNLVEVLNEETLNDTIRNEQVNRNRYTPDNPYPHH